MLRARRAVAAAVSLALSLCSGGVVAHADAGSTLYVDNSASANCTDTGGGAGSAATPYCAIQAADDDATPGETVSIAAGSYVGPVDITSPAPPLRPLCSWPRAEVP